MADRKLETVGKFFRLKLLINVKKNATGLDLLFSSIENSKQMYKNRYCCENSNEWKAKRVANALLRGKYFADVEHSRPRLW